MLHVAVTMLGAGQVPNIKVLAYKMWFGVEVNFQGAVRLTIPTVAFHTNDATQRVWTVKLPVNGSSIYHTSCIASSAVFPGVKMTDLLLQEFPPIPAGSQTPQVIIL